MSGSSSHSLRPIRGRSPASIASGYLSPKMRSRALLDDRKQYEALIFRGNHSRRRARWLRFALATQDKFAASHLVTRQSRQERHPEQADLKRLFWHHHSRHISHRNIANRYFLQHDRRRKNYAVGSQYLG